MRAGRRYDVRHGGPPTEIQILPGRLLKVPVSFRVSSAFVLTVQAPRSSKLSVAMAFTKPIAVALLLVSVLALQASAQTKYALYNFCE